MDARDAALPLHPRTHQQSRVGRVFGHLLLAALWIVVSALIFGVLTLTGLLAGASAM